MSVYVWGQAMEPDFPLAVLEYRTGQGEDRMHWHDHLEVALVLEGRGTFRFGRDELPAEPGDVFFINDALPHVALPEPGGALRLLLVLFRPELLAGPGCRDLDLGYLAPFRSDDAALARVPAASPLAMALEPVLGELLEVAERHDPAERHLLDATLRRALALAVRERCACARGGPAAATGTRAAGQGVATAGGDARSGAAAAHPGGEARERVRPVLAYLEGHCRDAVGLADAASVAHISPSRLRHLFKDVTGLGFKEYVTHIRLAEAKRLLLTTDLSVAEVAAAISYTNLHQFYRVFQRSCAMSPAEYRRYYTTTGATGTTGPTGATGILWATSAGTTGPQATPARPPRRERP